MSDIQETPDLHEQYDEDDGPCFIDDDGMEEIEDNGDELPEDDNDDCEVDADGEDGDLDEDRPSYEPDEKLEDCANAVIKVHTDAVVTVAISKKDPTIIISGSCDEVAYVHKVDLDGNVSQLAKLADHKDTITAIAFNFDSSLLATASYDSTVRVWNTADWSLVQTLEGPADDVDWIDWHPRGNCIIAGSKDATTWMWWATNGKVMQVFAGHGDEVTAGAFGLAGKVVCTASKDGTAIVFDPRTGQSNHSFEKKTRGWHQAPLASLTTHQHMPLMATGDEAGEVVVSNIESGTILVRVDNHNHSVESLSFANWPHPPAMLLSAALDGTGMVRDCSRFDARCTITNTVVVADENGKPVEHPEGWVEGITRAKMIHSGLPIVVTAGNDATARVYDARDGSTIALLTGHKAALLDVDICSIAKQVGDEKQWMLRVVSGGDDHTVRVFDVPAQRFAPDNVDSK